jgi:transcriptional regulator with XRE-family HTH domain
MSNETGLAWLKQQMSEKAKTQAELARLLDWEPSKVSRVISGKQRLPVGEIREIAQAIGCDASIALAQFGQRNGGAAINGSARLILEIRQEVTPDQAQRILAILNEVGRAG